jgi:hypothetical protein
MKKGVFWDVVLTDISEERIASIFRLAPVLTVS